MPLESSSALGGLATPCATAPPTQTRWSSSALEGSERLRDAGEITRAAHERWQIPAQETLRTLRQAIALDGKLSEEAREAFFALLTPSAKTG
ncbi:hypothetical protein ACWIG5_34420 [Streptomyces lydicus]